MKRLYHAFFYSLAGIKAALRDEAAFRTLVVLAVVGIVLALFLPFSIHAKLMIVFAHGATLIVELINTAIEAVVDRIGTERHPLSGKAKDCGSAAQFVMLFLLAIAWIAAIAKWV
jgi:diacylglycerol kinase (ATP)